MYICSINVYMIFANYNYRNFHGGNNEEWAIKEIGEGINRCNRAWEEMQRRHYAYCKNWNMWKEIWWRWCMWRYDIDYCELSSYHVYWSRCVKNSGRVSLKKRVACWLNDVKEIRKKMFGVSSSKAIIICLTGDCVNNKFGEAMARYFNATMLDNNYILWKIVDRRWIGKRSVQMNDLSHKWLENVEDRGKIKTWSCGKLSDYNEIFIRKG